MHEPSWIESPVLFLPEALTLLESLLSRALFLLWVDQRIDRKSQGFRLLRKHVQG